MNTAIKKNKKEKGQGLVEYALILVLVSIVVIGALNYLAPIIGNVFSTVGGTLASTGGGAAVLSVATEAPMDTCTELRNAQDAAYQEWSTCQRSTCASEQTAVNNCDWDEPDLTGCYAAGDALGICQDNANAVTCSAKFQAYQDATSLNLNTCLR